MAPPGTEEIVSASVEATWDGLSHGQRFVCIFDLGKGWKRDIKTQQGERCEVMQLEVISSPKV